MKEETTLALLSQFMKKLLNHCDQNWDPEELGELSERLADAAWNALILFVRLSLTRGEPATFEEIGRFERTDTGVHFEPAASLLEAAALDLKTGKGRTWTAERAVFYLTQGVDLLETIPENLELEIAPINREQEVIVEVFGKKTYPRSLSNIARDTALRLLQITNALELQETEATAETEPKPTIKLDYRSDVLKRVVGWYVKSCEGCGSSMLVHRGWDDPPRFCKSCLAEGAAKLKASRRAEAVTESGQIEPTPETEIAQEQ